MGRNNKGLEIVEIAIPENSTTVGKQVRDLTLPPGSMLSLIIRKERKPILPTTSTILRAEDQIIAVIRPEQEEELRAALTGR